MIPSHEQKNNDLTRLRHPIKPTHTLANRGKIPWDNPDFSKRMLKEHLTQQHGAASRKSEKIAQHTHFIHHHILGQRPSHILDLGCGPGLYMQHLAQHGHTCTGIDFGPASIAYEQAHQHNLNITYMHQDIRHANYGVNYDLIMLIFGEFNTFNNADVQQILQKSKQALKPNGVLLLEPHPYDAIKKIGQQDPSWSKQKSGLFSDRPHLWLEENVWDEITRTATTRHTIIDAETHTITQHSTTMQAYSQQEYEHLLKANRFENITFYPALTGIDDPEQPDLIAITAQ